MRIIHVSSVNPDRATGMGRIAYFWKQAIQSAGHEFIHIGWDEINKKIHPLFFGWYARRYILGNRLKADLILSHEPYGGFLKFNNIPLVVFSHGVEEVEWTVRRRYRYDSFTLKSLFIPSFIRFLSNNIGFCKAALILLSNRSNQLYLIEQKRIALQRTFIFKNGYSSYNTSGKVSDLAPLIILFNGSWIGRKGITQLVHCFEQLTKKYDQVILRLAGTGMNREVIKSFFSEKACCNIDVVESFSEEQEYRIYDSVSIFVQPSFFEGKSLALIQAMSMGICPVVTDNSGQIDLIEHDKNGLLFKTGDHIDFFNQITRLMDNPRLLSKLSLAAQLAVQEYNWDRASKEVVDKLMLVVNGSN